MKSMPHYVLDAYVFCREGGRPLYLLLRRAAGKRYAGQWRTVTGKIAEDERPTDAALREVMEETGLQPTGIWALDYTHTFYDPDENCVKISITFAVEVASTGIRLSEEHDDSRWITFDQAQGMLRWPGQREGMHRAHEDVVTPPDRGAMFRVTSHE